MNRTISTVIFAIFLGILPGCRDKGPAKTPEAALKNIIDAADSKDAAFYKANWDEETRRTTYSREEVIQSMMSLLPDSISDIETQSKNETDATLSFKTGETHGKAILVKEADGWKVDLIDIEQMCHLE